MHQQVRMLFNLVSSLLSDAYGSGEVSPIEVITPANRTTTLSSERIPEISR
jgi:hypothetical protein